MKTKFTLFIIFIIGFFLSANAQITLDQNNTPHSISFSDVHHLQFVPSADLPLEGTDINYDYSSLGESFSEPREYSPAIRVDFTDFTRFFLGKAFLGPLDIISEYYTKITPEGIAYVGSYKLEEALSLAAFTGNPSDSLIFSGNNTLFEEPDYSLKFPTTFGTNWVTNGQFHTDFSISVAAFGLSGVPGYQEQYKKTEYSTVGWGKLTIPTENGVSIPYNVILIKEQETTIDSIFLGGAPAPAAFLSAFGLTQGMPDTLNSYFFYAEGFEGPILDLEMSNDWQTIETSIYVTENIETAIPPIYVDIDAAGNNDGSSWANAYTNLSNAIENANLNEEVWVAEGTYLPNVPSVSPDPTKRVFLLWKDLEIYGGFNGTESDKSQRDPSIQITILSGDINGDDIIDDFDTNRSDNIDNVVFGFNTVSNACILDGFTISGGQADGSSTIHSNVRGAGMYSLAPVQIINCFVTQNYALNHGGGIYYYEAEASGGSVLNSTFEKNEAGMNGGGLFAAFVTGDGIKIDSCNFRNNTAGDSGGGFISVRSRCEINNSNFDTNNSLIGSGGGSSLSNALDITVSNCHFTGNSSGDSGGGASATLLSPNQSITIEDCTFTDNSAGSTGGGLYCQGTEANNQINIDACTFTGNHSASFIATGGGLEVVYASFANGGSALIEDCTVMNNTTVGSGGGIGLRDQATGDNQIEIRNCNIEGNTADFNAGGILYYKAGNSNSEITISQTTITNNTSPEALGIGFSSVTVFNPDQSIKIENCVLKDHVGANSTAAIVIESLPVEIINCTLTGAAPAILAKEVTDIRLQNSILHTPNFANAIASSDESQFSSLGGNLFSDVTGDEWILQEDQLGADPIFETDATTLSENSPAIDMGTLPSNPSEFDVNGKARIQGSCIDIGAHESVYDAGISSCVTVGVKEELISSSVVEIFPNPVVQMAQVRIENDWSGVVSLTVINVFGQAIQSTTLEKRSKSDSWNFDTSQLQNGTYRLLLSNGKQLVVKSFVVIR